MGKVMAVLKPKLAGRADMAAVVGPGQGEARRLEPALPSVDLRSPPGAECPAPLFAALSLAARSPIIEAFPAV